MRRNQLDRFSKFLNAVPRSKRANKTCDYLIVSNTQLAPHLCAANTRSKALHINAIRIDNDLLRRDTARFQVATLNIRDDKNTRRGVKVQSLVSLQEVETADTVPVPAHPDFRPVVLEKQRSLRSVRGHHTGPAKTRISLINEIRIGTLDQRHCATREHEVVVNIEERARAATRLRRHHSETIF